MFTAGRQTSLEQPLTPSALPLERVAAFLNRLALVARKARRPFRMRQLNLVRIVPIGVVFATFLTSQATTARAQQVADPQPAADPVAVTPQPPPPAVAPYATAGLGYQNWFASGFAGASFGMSGDATEDSNIDASTTYGGNIGYMWHNIYGAEFLADFAPSVKIGSELFAKHPHVNSYMFNLIAAVPIGTEHNVQPFVSGGLGGIQMATDFVTLSGEDTNTIRESRFGVNIGGGLMGYGGHVGFRTDVRYYHASTIDNLDSRVERTPGENLTLGLLSGMHFWRATAGVAFRW
jgi:hypothetical protein